MTGVLCLCVCVVVYVVCGEREGDFEKERWLGNDAVQNDGVEWASSSQRAHVRGETTTGTQPGRPPDTKKVSDKQHARDVRPALTTDE